MEMRLNNHALLLEIYSNILINLSDQIKLLVVGLAIVELKLRPVRWAIGAVDDTIAGWEGKNYDINT